MAEIFLSYAREDLAKAKVLASALEKQGWCVFWDRSSILAGQDFDLVIEQAIKDAKCMIVGWSNASKQSDWVRGEATIGREQRMLLPVLFEPVQPPIAFRSLHTEDLSTWTGDTKSPAFLALIKAIRQRVELNKSSLIAPPENQTPSNIPLPKPTKTDSTNHNLGKLVGGVLALGTLGGIAIQFMPENQHSSNSAAPLFSTTVPQNQIKLPEMVTIPAGEFWMGSADDDNRARINEKPRHKVEITSFSLGKYEITKAEFSAFVNDSGHQASGCNIWKVSEWIEDSEKNWQNPGFNQSDSDPVTCVSYYDAIAYIHWLKNKTGLNYRLPTESEWEYAARAGTTGDFYWGLDPSVDYAWYANNSQSKTHPVGEKKPNGFGLYDTAGNVREFIQDCSENDYKQGPNNELSKISTDCSAHVLRGGSWSSRLENLRSAYRDWNNSEIRYNGVGFRIALD